MTLSPTDDGCGDPLVLAEYERAKAEIEVSSDTMAKMLLKHHLENTENRTDFTDCQKDPRRQALIGMWNRWRNG